jgi:hypothetical protein
MFQQREQKMATINDMGIPQVGTGILQPKLKNRWRVTFANMGGGTNSQPLSLQATTATRPSVSFEEVQLDRYNSRAYVAGKYQWEPITITIEDDITGSASKVIREQIQQQQWLTGAEGPFLAATPEGSGYKFTTNIDMLDGNEQLVEKWIVEGCWIQNVEYGDLDYAASEAVLITMTLRFDHARQNIGGYSYGQGVALGS